MLGKKRFIKLIPSLDDSMSDTDHWPDPFSIAKDRCTSQPLEGADPLQLVNPA